MEGNGTNGIGATPAFESLEKQKALLDTEIGLSDRERDGLQELFESAALQPKMLYESKKPEVFDVQQFFQTCLDDFENMTRGKFSFNDIQLESILLRLNKMLYHTYQMHFSENGDVDSHFIAFGKKLRVKNEPFELESVIEFASESFRRDLGSAL